MLIRYPPQGTSHKRLISKFAKFDEIPSIILEVIKETKRFGHTVGRSVGLSDNVKTVYPPTNTVCGGYN